MKYQNYAVSKNITLIVLVFATLSSCHPDKADKIIDQVIEQHGGEAYEVFELAFDFRDRHYTASRSK